MKGIVIDCKTNEMIEIDDGLPTPQLQPYSEPQGVDLQVVAQKLKEFDQVKKELDLVKADLEKLEATKS